MSDEFSETLAVPDLRPGKPGLELTLEQGVVIIGRVGGEPAQVDYATFVAAVADLDDRPGR